MRLLFVFSESQQEDRDPGIRGLLLIILSLILLRFAQVVWRGLLSVSV